MHVKKKTLTPTKVALTIDVDQDLLNAVKHDVLTHLAQNHVKIQGFRQGKAPLALVEKQADPNVLQSEFLDSALNRSYGQALDHEKLRPVSQPEVKITKFVPFSMLEYEAEVEVVGEVKLPDYTTYKVEKKKVTVGAKDVDEVIKSLQARMADKKEVEREAREGDEVTIDFAGADAKTKEPIQGADGKGYPLQLGSNSFIPGFETNLVGMKPGEEKTFDLTFPKDYGVAALQNRKVTFAVTVQKVQELDEPKVDDEFAKKVGPFESLADLKADIKKQVTAEREAQATRDFQNELLEKISEDTEAAIPESLIQNEIDRMEQEERQNLMYRGQTWKEHLELEGVTEEEHRERQQGLAEARVRSGLMLAEVAEKEGITVSEEEIETQMAMLRAQYPDPQMQTELEKPETRREIMSRLVSEKTIAKLADYATAKK